MLESHHKVRVISFLLQRQTLRLFPAPAVHRPNQTKRVTCRSLRAKHVTEKPLFGRCLTSTLGC